MAASISIDDIGPDERRKLGVRKPRVSAFGADDVRGWALRVLGAMAGLTREQRARVLRHAAKVNKV